MIYVFSGTLYPTQSISCIYIEANRQSNGIGQISTAPARGSKYTRKSMLRCHYVGGLGEHVTCHMFWRLRRPFYL